MTTEFQTPTPMKVKAYTVLKKAIITGEFTDHEMVSERVVQEKFNISRTPYREAIQVLEREEWVYSIPYKGTYVKPITLKDLDEFFDFRMILELGIIDHIKPEKVNSLIEKLQELINYMSTDDKKQSSFEFITLDQEFHKQLYEFTDNNRVKAVSEQISDIALRIGIRTLRRESRRDDVIKEHQEIIKGFKNGTAKESLRKHLERARHSFIEIYKEIAIEEYDTLQRQFKGNK